MNKNRFALIAAASPSTALAASEPRTKSQDDRPSIRKGFAPMRPDSQGELQRVRRRLRLGSSR